MELDTFSLRKSPPLPSSSAPPWPISQTHSCFCFLSRELAPGASCSQDHQATQFRGTIHNVHLAAWNTSLCCFKSCQSQRLTVRLIPLRKFQQWPHFHPTSPTSRPVSTSHLGSLIWIWSALNNHLIIWGVPVYSVSRGETTVRGKLSIYTGTKLCLQIELPRDLVQGILAVEGLSRRSPW